MDPASAAVGFVSLATAVSGIFVSLVECYEFVDLGRRFGSDFEKSQARLAALKLQLTRWGISAGTLPDPKTGQHRDVMVEKGTAETAVRLLTSIQDDTLEVEQKSLKYISRSASENSQELATIDPHDMTVSIRDLNSRTNTIVTKRVGTLKWTRKARWAIFEKRLFDRLLEDITENLGLLEGLLPVEPRQELCHMELKEFQNDLPQAVLDLLCQASQANNDTLLVQAVHDAISSRVTRHSWVMTNIDGHTKLHQGDRIASNFGGQAPLGRVGHNFGVTNGKGRSIIHQGDSYGDDAMILNHVI
jgi:hypothetical protein